MELLNEYHFVVQWLGLFSVVTFIGSLIAIPMIIARLPVDYFIRHRQKIDERHALHPLMGNIVFVLRNGFGSIFLLAGLAMLILPGQGIITILIGISLMDFPKKHTVVDYFVSRPQVIKLLNWIRSKENKPPFVFR